MALVDVAPALMLAAALAGGANAADGSGDGEPAFRALYKELIETNTSHSVGSCTLAAERMSARLKAAGYTDEDVRLFAPDEFPKDGGLVAVLHGTGSKQKPILLLAHVDVVEAKREDWTRDPFTLIEESGYFYGRGTSDDKSMAAIFTDLLIRYKQEGYKRQRDIKLALTCGEETSGAFNGADWLATHHRDWIDAAYALNEGGDGELDADGKRVVLDVEAAQKVYQDYQLETTNPGGHSSQPVPDNALYEMATAITRLSKFEFPILLSDTTRAYFTKMSGIVGGEMGKAMLALVRNPGDAQANAIVSSSKKYHSILRTTCVPTMISGGHAENALPQSVRTNVNCRIMPGTPIESVRASLAAAIDDPNVKVTISKPISPATPSPALSAEVLEGVQAVAARLYPGTPVLPTLQTGASDGIYVSAHGIPTYGVSGIFVDPDLGNIHGLNERVRVKALMDGRTFHYQLVKLLADR
jgi:acetylornithine deacetylase/succinyl-diaminopimelate desuccinylase-like protein